MGGKRARPVLVGAMLGAIGIPVGYLLATLVTPPVGNTGLMLVLLGPTMLAALGSIPFLAGPHRRMVLPFVAGVVASSIFLAACVVGGITALAYLLSERPRGS